ncbi:MAG TPA: hypothetical protein VJT15_24860 [Pyrinomonadaceae bacterium]|nr:hypothetical protein [Pyrinomonadaceae bacterium]
MGRRFTLDEYLETFAKEEIESLPDAISVRVSDAQVRRLGFVFLNLMGGVLQCLRKPPRRRGRGPASKLKQKRGPDEDLIGNETAEDIKSSEDITQDLRNSYEHKR